MKQKVLTWDQLIEIGMTKYSPKNVKDTIEYRLNEPKPGNCCTFIYTSGTTGPPKAVMISHDNYTWIADATVKRFNFDTPEKIGKGRMLSLLPLSHVAAQLTDLVIGAKMGYNLYFADPSALQGNLVRFLQVCRP
jgi:long-chain-fatty-acid--CoA ligase ACSBG